jgi:hypothetical protein
MQSLGVIVTWIGTPHRARFLWVPFVIEKEELGEEEEKEERKGREK